MQDNYKFKYLIQFNYIILSQYMQISKNSITALFKTQNNWKPATGGECVHKQLGNIVDVEWIIKDGIIRVSKSEEQVPKTTYQKNQPLGIQILRGIPFRHGSKCPLMNKSVVLNDQKIMKPCASVMLFDRNTNQILITQRSAQLRTFPNAWVLPGGHLDPGQGVVQGGIRQCQQEVGLPKDAKLQQIIRDGQVMLWQSVYTQEGHVKGCALCLFFVISSQKFDVKVQPRQVSQYKWKQINDKTDQLLYNPQTKVGYAEGHLSFLSQIRQKISKQSSKL